MTTIAIVDYGAGNLRSIHKALEHVIAGRKAPHIGWNVVETRADHPFLAGLAPHSYFYFVHSYYSSRRTTAG